MMKFKRRRLKEKLLEQLSSTALRLAGYYNKEFDHKPESHGPDANTSRVDSDKDVIDGCTRHHEEVSKRLKDLVRKDLWGSEIKLRPL